MAHSHPLHESNSSIGDEYIPGNYHMRVVVAPKRARKPLQCSAILRRINSMIRGEGRITLKAGTAKLSVLPKTPSKSTQWNVSRACAPQWVTRQIHARMRILQDEEHEKTQREAVSKSLALTKTKRPQSAPLTKCKIGRCLSLQRSETVSNICPTHRSSVESRNRRHQQFRIELRRSSTPNLCVVPQSVSLNQRTPVRTSESTSARLRPSSSHKLAKSAIEAFAKAVRQHDRIPKPKVPQQSQAELFINKGLVSQSNATVDKQISSRRRRQRRLPLSAVRTSSMLDAYRTQLRRHSSA